MRRASRWIPRKSVCRNRHGHLANPLWLFCRINSGHPAEILLVVSALLVIWETVPRLKRYRPPRTGSLRVAAIGLSASLRWRYERTPGRLRVTRDELLARLAGLRQARVGQVRGSRISRYCDGERMRADVRDPHRGDDPVHQRRIRSAWLVPRLRGLRRCHSHCWYPRRILSAVSCGGPGTACLHLARSPGKPRL
jgi:hypothetical protein